MIHVVFNENEADLMKRVMELDETLNGEVVVIKDDFAVGPIHGLDTEEGWQARTDWWKSLLSVTPYGEQLAGSFDDRETVKALKTRLEEDTEEVIWIWMGQNQHDVCGYYWLMPQLRDFQGRVMVLYLNNLPFINEKGQLFYPSWLSEIQPSEYLKAKKLERPITLSEFEIDPDEWRKLTEENSMVRSLEGGKKILGQGVDFYDAEILKNLSADWQKASRVVTNTFNRMKIKTGDVFIMWRIKQMIQDEKIDMLGDPAKGWKEFDIKLPGSKQNSGEVSEASVQS